MAGGAIWAALSQGGVLILLGLQGYQWLKDKVQSEGSKKQQAKVLDLLPIAHQLGCTVAQLAIGETLPAPGPCGDPHLLRGYPWVSDLTLGRTSSVALLKVWVLGVPINSLSSLLWPQHGVSAARVSARSCWGCQVQSSC